MLRKSQQGEQVTTTTDITKLNDEQLNDLNDIAYLRYLGYTKKQIHGMRVSLDESIWKAAVQLTSNLHGNRNASRYVKAVINDRRIEKAEAELVA